MVKYLLRRFCEMILTLFLIATATFFLLEAVPGDPLSQRADKLQPQAKETLYKRYGLDKPVMERYAITMVNMAKGDFGESFVYAGQTIGKLVHDRLGIQQMLLGVTIGLLLGILAATRRGTIADYMVVGLSVLLISVPHLIFGLLLQKVFAGNLRWFPTIGWPAGKDLWVGGWEYTSMLDVINQDYVLTAESKGLSRAAVVRRHILRNSFIPVMTQLPMSVAMCITGSFFIESIFSIPGIGQYFVTAVNNQDLSIVLGETVLLAALYIVVLFITDILYVLVDPRIGMPGSGK